jgi:hypothetical protein
MLKNHPPELQLGFAYHPGLHPLLLRLLSTSGWPQRLGYCSHLAPGLAVNPGRCRLRQRADSFRLTPLGSRSLLVQPELGLVKLSGQASSAAGDYFRLAGPQRLFSRSRPAAAPRTPTRLAGG